MPEIMSGLNSPHPSSRLQRAKSELSHDRSTGSLKNELRNKFFIRLKNNRSRSVDRFRQIVEDYGEIHTYRSINDLKVALEGDPEAVNLMKDTEVNEILRQIEQELSQVDFLDQADRYERDKESETEDIVNRHLVLCKVCQNMSTEGNICTTCISNLKDEFAE